MNAAGPLWPGPARPATLGRRLERAGKRWGSRLLAAAARPQPVRAEDVARLGVRDLLVVRQHNQMGDMVCALPALAALRRAWPAARLTFVTSPLCEPLLRDHPDIDTLIVFRKEEMWAPHRFAALLRRLRVPRPDLAIVMTTVSFSTTSALLAWASGARVRIGCSSRPFGSDLSRAVYHWEFPPQPEATAAPVSEVEHHLAPLRALGIDASFATPQLVARPEAVARAHTFLAEALPGPGPLVVAHAGAGKRPNIYPAESFAAVLGALQRDDGARVVLTQGPSDAAATGAVAALLPAAVRWGEPLGATLGLLQCADAVLSNDTGMAHVAGACGAPTVVLFGPTDAQRWKPPGEHVRAVLSPTGFIGGIEPETVLAAVRLALATGRRAAERSP